MNQETPWKFVRKWHKKWKVIDRDKYPSYGIVKENIFDGVPTQQFVGYIKDDVLCFYWGTGKAKFNQMSGMKIIFTLHRESINKIKEWIYKNDYKGKVAFELCEMEQLNRVIDYMIKRQGYETIREHKFLFVLPKK